MNLLKAIINLTEDVQNRLRNSNKTINRANAQGEALEEYIKDLFANTRSCTDELERARIHENVFSYLGNANNPPDIILKNGDAIEVKKITSFTADLALNSSYPKSKLFSNSPMITKACRDCEDWEEKDIIYIVGIIKNNNLKQLIFIYGADYAASDEVYNKIKVVISKGIKEISGVEFAETKELGKVKKVDPLGITDLRIRGMWHISNPLKVYDYIYKTNENDNLNFVVIINEEKFNSFPLKDKLVLEELGKNEKLIIKNTSIKDPNNPAKLKKVKLITNI